MTYDEWEEKFIPTKNSIDDNASYDGIMFETFGPELEAVRNADPDCVWTLICDDEADNDVILKGYHLVNRMGYFITEVKATAQDPDEIQVAI